MKFYSVRSSFVVVLSALSLFSSAQKNMGKCGVLTPAGKRSLTQQRVDEQQLKMFMEGPLADNDALYILPVVVHVIHTGGAIGTTDNPSDASIFTMLQNLNNSWRKQGPVSGGVDMRIQFQLAQRSPAGTATTGINRVDGSGIPDYASGGIALNNTSGSAPQDVVKSVSLWPNTDYINIWLVNKIDGDPFSPGGFAFFPQHTDAAIDGIVINAAILGNADSKLIAHEMGHVFELYHTFHDESFNFCPRLDSCAEYGDLVCDTEPSPQAFVCDNNVNSCTNQPYQVADEQFNYSVLHNYMNHTDCGQMFTAGQKLRVRAALLWFRPSLINSGGLLPPPGVSPTSACIPSAANGTSNFYGLERLEFAKLNVYSNSSGGDRNNYVDRTMNQRTPVYKGVRYTLRVTGSYMNPHAYKVYLDYNNNGNFFDAGEELLSAYTFDGSASIEVTIPISGVVENTPLRLRVAADNPAPGFPTFPSPCMLNGDGLNKAGQIEDFTVVIVGGNPVQSVKSGAWNDPTTWSCNCVPQAGDIITIKTGHSISITQAMGTVEVSILNVESGATLDIGANADFRQKK
jgi:hypothetical protein